MEFGEASISETTLSKEEKTQKKPWLIDIPGSIRSQEVRIFADTNKTEPVTPGSDPAGVIVFPTTDKPVPVTPGTFSPDEVKPQPLTSPRRKQERE